MWPCQETYTPQQLLLHTRNKRVYACKPVLPGISTIQLLTENLQNYLVLDNLPFTKKPSTGTQNSSSTMTVPAT